MLSAAVADSDSVMRSPEVMELRADTGLKEAIVIVRAESTYRKGNRKLSRRKRRDPHLALQANGLARQGDERAREGQWKAAADHYAAALEICPRYVDIRCKYGRALYQLKDIHSAVEQYRLALEINPRYADAHAHLGLALRAMGNEKTAREEFLAALESNPDQEIAVEALNQLKAS